MNETVERTGLVGGSMLMAWGLGTASAIAATGSTVGDLPTPVPAVEVSMALNFEPPTPGTSRAVFRDRAVALTSRDRPAVAYLGDAPPANEPTQRPAVPPAIAAVPGALPTARVTLPTAAPPPPPDPAAVTFSVETAAPQTAIAADPTPVSRPRSPSLPTPTTAPDASVVAAPAAPALPYGTLDELFAGGSDSLVARAVGGAEGTRRPDGGRNPAYYGHTDPGNGVWNLGSFSYQHGARSPEDADAKQLRRLQGQAATLRQKAATHHIKLNLVEELNGIDLANQAPLAALDRGGYIERLVEAYQMGLRGDEAIVWARTRSFIDPDTQRWNAPGLGNNLQQISHDQHRRHRAIQQAIYADPIWRQVKTSGQPRL